MYQVLFLFLLKFPCSKMDYPLFCAYTNNLYLYKCTAVNLRHFPEALRLVKRNCFRGIIRHQLELTHMTVFFQNRPQECGANTVSLIFREYQNVLYEHDSVLLLIVKRSFVATTETGRCSNVIVSSSKESKFVVQIVPCK